VNDGIGEIKFSNSEKGLSRLLGSPLSTEKFDRNKSVLYRYVFKNVEIDIFYNERKSKSAHMSIHTNKLKLSGIEISTLKEIEILNLVKKYHKKFQIPFKYIYEDTQLDVYYDFVNLGLTIWIENNVVSDISISQLA
jgi:hypothetical protein